MSIAITIKLRCLNSRLGRVQMVPHAASVASCNSCQYLRQKKDDSILTRCMDDMNSVVP